MELQGSVVTQTVLGGLTKNYIFQLQISCRVYRMYMPKNYESWLTVDKVIAIIIRLIVFLVGPVFTLYPVHCILSFSATFVRRLTFDV